MVRLHIPPNNLQSLASQIDLFRCNRTASGFRGVYKHKRNHDGVDVYCARVKRNGVLRTIPGSYHTEPRRCVPHLIAWYTREYGPGWPDVLAARKRTPWRIVPAGDWFKACVWVDGVREWVTVTEKRRNAWKVTGRVQAFPTREKARDGITIYLARAYGLFGWVMLHRRGRAAGSPGR